MDADYTHKHARITDCNQCPLRDIILNDIDSCGYPGRAGPLRILVDRGVPDECPLRTKPAVSFTLIELGEGA